LGRGGFLYDRALSIEISGLLRVFINKQNNLFEKLRQEAIKVYQLDEEFFILNAFSRKYLGNSCLD
jgi:hypothetical protein